MFVTPFSARQGRRKKAAAWSALALAALAILLWASRSLGREDEENPCRSAIEWKEIDHHDLCAGMWRGEFDGCLRVEGP